MPIKEKYLELDENTSIVERPNDNKIMRAKTTDKEYLAGNKLGGFANAIAENASNAITGSTEAICNSVNGYNVRKVMENRDNNDLITAMGRDDPNYNLELVDLVKNGKDREKTKRYFKQQEERTQRVLIKETEKTRRTEIIQKEKTNRANSYSDAAVNISQNTANTASETVKEVSKIIRSNGSGFKQM